MPSADPTSPATTAPLAVGSVSLRLYPHDLPAPELLDHMRAQARLGVEAGFDGVMVSEHHGGFAGYIADPAQVVGFLLPGMPRGWAAPCPMLLPMRPPALIAEQVAWLAAAFPGRVGAGFAAGALPLDFEMAEVPFDEIIPRFKDALPKVVAALRGQGEGPIADDHAVRACAERPVPMAAAAQSRTAVRRAARMQLAVLYNSFQTVERQREMSETYDEAGGAAAKVLIRRVWVGPQPQENIDRSMEHYRSYTSDAAQASWGPGDRTVVGATGEEVAQQLLALMEGTGCDTVNLRVHVLGLTPDQVNEQIERLGAETVPVLRAELVAS